jgi:hypothetical protein
VPNVIGLDDNLPRPRFVPSLDNEAPFDNIRPMAARVLEHPTEVDFV